MKLSMYPQKKKKKDFFNESYNGQDFQNLIFSPYLLKFLVINRNSSAYLISLIEVFFEKQCKCQPQQRDSEAWEASSQKWPVAMNPPPVTEEL